MSDIEVLVRFISAGAKVLSARIALFLTLLLTFALFAWSVYAPDVLRIATATIFAVLVFIPVVRLEMSQKKDETTGG